MKRFKQFIKTTVLGGVIVILPVVLTFFFLRWLFNFITNLIKPLTHLLAAQSQLQKYIADFLVIATIVLICFLVGLVVKTRFGRFIYRVLENRLLTIAPGYDLFKETIKQLLGRDKAPFSSVALVQVFGGDSTTMMTGFITDQHPDGFCTVFVPAALTPTAGYIYHVEEKYVHRLGISVEEAMRSIISCGMGSQKYLEHFLQKKKEIPSASGGPAGGQTFEKV
jgi:uncharacterized membrane protein